MNIELFNKAVQHDEITSLVERSSNYEGLHVDMRNDEQRRFVKGMARDGKRMLKTLDRTRIDLIKAFTNDVNAEFRPIAEKVKGAINPFTALIDADNAKLKADRLAKKKLVDDVQRKAAEREVLGKVKRGLMQVDGMDEQRAVALTLAIKNGEVPALVIKF